MVITGTPIGTQTSITGSFVLPIPDSIAKTSFHIVVTYVGFKVIDRTIEPKDLTGLQQGIGLKTGYQPGH